MHTGIHMLYPAFGMTIYGQIENVDRRVEQLRIQGTDVPWCRQRGERRVYHKRVEK